MKDFLKEIDRYLDDEMNADEKATFENQLTVDKNLNEAFLFEKEMRLIYDDQDWLFNGKATLRNQRAKDIQDYLKSDEIKHVTSAIKEVIEDQKDVKTSQNRKWYVPLSIAASIIVVISMSYSIFFTSSEDNSILFDTYYNEAITALPSTINRNETNNALQKGQTFFDEKNYTEAINSLLAYQKNNTEVINPIAYSLCGFSYLALQDLKKSEEQFLLLKNSNTLQAKKADWYLALTYLKGNKTKKLKEVLKKITSDSKNYNFNTAKILLDKLE
ncbi:hypothetical protein [Tenacibaculum jejuense]|uniref:Tetratricopeptide repeat protein n=1 Tax=Tenacibaculum jejuense TaxID=584609 RepID=A0A238U8Z2_9FLAO|nr:hypothetical protein [Tenacibaculum jejuense]SNR15466.1 protein of unknown function [Tenacibaculum jejuense]